MSIRERFEKAIAGEPIDKPVYAAYDWFVENRDIDWKNLFEQGMGQIGHADLLNWEKPNVEIIETQSEQNGRTRTDIRWVTDIGELHEYYIGEWRQEYLVKKTEDYKIVGRALSDSKFMLTEKAFDESEAKLGDSGITVGQLGPLGTGRTPFQKIQVDYAGLEKFSIDIVLEVPELMELLELMNEVLYKQIECILPSKVNQIKLWENLSIVTMGPGLFRRYLAPVYEKILKMFEGTEKKLLVHYDGKLKVVANDIAKLAFDGIDSLTPPPEGDLQIAEARSFWPNKFFWLHPSLSWFHLPEEELMNNIRQLAKDAGQKRFCVMLSEEIPPDWERTIPAVLRTLDSLE